MSVKIHAAELLNAYSEGYFPMAHPEEENQIYWHQPEMRGIIPLEDFYVNRNLRKLYEKGTFTYSINKTFDSVIRACAERDSTWISEEIIEMYNELNSIDQAFSVEVWRDEKLVGGLYGVHMNKAFFGESMFSRETNTSKLALVHLVRFLKLNDFLLLDTQYLNDHLKQFGAIEIPHKKYMKLLQLALTD